MNSVLQSRMGGKAIVPIIRKAGTYNHAPVHLMGHFNSPVKSLDIQMGIQHQNNYFFIIYSFQKGI